MSINTYYLSQTQDNQNLISHPSLQSGSSSQLQITEIATNKFTQLQATASEKYERAFKHFPEKEMYRLYIDKNKHHLGEDGFDKNRPEHPGEPGYKSAMIKAFEFIKNTIGKQVDAEYFRDLHAVCTDGVLKYKYVGSYSYDYAPIKKEFTPGNHYGFDFNKVSCKARRELETEKLLSISNANDSDYLSHLDLKKGRIFSNFGNKMSQEEGIKKINSFCNRYYQDLATEDNKIASIVRLCRSLEIYHVFEDGNQRAVVFALLNKLLIENDFSPCILDDPEVFDGYHSICELIEDVNKGMQNFKDFESSFK